MNRDDIVLMARKAGGIECDCCLPYLQDYSEKELAGFLERFAELIATAEREACAELCSRPVVVQMNPRDNRSTVGANQFIRPKTASECATAIRARGES